MFFVNRSTTICITHRQLRNPHTLKEATGSSVGRAPAPPFPTYLGALHRREAPAPAPTIAIAPARAPAHAVRAAAAPTARASIAVRARRARDGARVRAAAGRGGEGARRGAAARGRRGGARVAHRRRAAGGHPVSFYFPVLNSFQIFEIGKLLPRCSLAVGAEN